MTIIKKFGKGKKMSDSIENFMFSNLETTMAIVHKYSDIIGQPFRGIAEKLQKHIEDKESDTMLFEVDEDDFSGRDPLLGDTIYVYVRPGNGSKKPSWYVKFKNRVNFFLQIEIFNLNPYGYYLEQPPNIQLKLFDDDKALNKVPAQHIKENISKLLGGQIDTFLDADTEGDYWIKKSNLHYRIVKARFKFQQLDPVYMGISRKSSFKDQAKKFGRNLKYLVDHGVVQRLVEKYTK